MGNIRYINLILKSSHNVPHAINIIKMLCGNKARYGGVAHKEIKKKALRKLILARHTSGSHSDHTNEVSQCIQMS